MYLLLNPHFNESSMQENELFCLIQHYMGVFSMCNSAQHTGSIQRTLTEGAQNSPLLRCGLPIVTSSQSAEYGRVLKRVTLL